MNVVRMHKATNLNLVLIAWLTCSWQIKILISVKAQQSFCTTSHSVAQHTTQKGRTTARAIHPSPLLKKDIEKRFYQLSVFTVHNHSTILILKILQLSKYNIKSETFLFSFLLLYQTFLIT